MKLASGWFIKHGKGKCPSQGALRPARGGPYTKRSVAEDTLKLLQTCGCTKRCRVVFMRETAPPPKRPSSMKAAREILKGLPSQIHQSTAAWNELERRLAAALRKAAR